MEPQQKMWKLIQALLVTTILKVSSFSFTHTHNHRQIRPPESSYTRFATDLSSESNPLSSTPEIMTKEPIIKILGITGGIGSGKSTACQILTSSEFQSFHNCEVYHIDTDSLAHLVYAPGSEAIRQIRDEFGDEVIALERKGDNDDEEEIITIDRKKLGGVVFSDPAAMSKLEQIVWPHVKTKILEKINEILSLSETSTSPPNKPKIAILEAAVLLDANWSNLLSALWILQAPPSTTSTRLETNRNISHDDAMTRIQAQQSRRGIGNLQEEIEKKEVNAVIENVGTLDDLKESLKKTWLDCESWRDGVVPLGENTIKTV